MSATTLLRKLTIKTAGLDIATIKAALKDSAKIEILSIVGTSSAARPGVTQLGEFLELSGNFAATNLVTGEMFSSGKCILPNFISLQLGDAISQAGDVEFGLVLIAVKNEKSVTGYQFEMRSLIETKPTDKMAALMAMMPAAKPLQLEISEETRAAVASDVAAKQAAEDEAKATETANKTAKKK